MRRLNVNEIFIEVYKAFPASIMGREDIDLSNSIILPASALGVLSSMRNFKDSKNPILFRILNIELNMATHCGVAEFTAQEGTCYLPSNMFERLCLMEGQQVNIRNVDLKEGKFIKLQPHLTEFIYFCVTEGDTISVKFSKKIYKLDIVQCKPAKAIRTLNTDIEVDFCPPKDYKEEPRNNDSFRKTGSGSIKFNSNEKVVKPLTKEEIKKQIEDKKFSGHHFRMDGKEVTNVQLNKIMKAKQEKNNEENYNPRDCRIISNPRPSFKYVEL